MPQGKGGSSKRGFAAMDEKKQREIASKGGKASHEGGRGGGGGNSGGGRGGRLSLRPLYIGRVDMLRPAFCHLSETVVNKS